jgi:hypothetical protein
MAKAISGDAPLLLSTPRSLGAIRIVPYAAISKTLMGHYPKAVRLLNLLVTPSLKVNYFLEDVRRSPFKKQLASKNQQQH